MSSIADTFNRADADPLGTSSDTQFTWNELIGDFDIIGNSAVSGTSGEAVARAEFDMATDDFYVQAQFQSSTNIAILARFSSTVSNTYYLLQVGNSTTLQLFKRVAGTFTQLGSDVTISHSNGDTYKLDCSGSTISGYQNGVQKISQSDSAISGSGNRRGGLRADSLSAVYNDFAAADVAAAAATVNFLTLLDAGA